MILGTIAFNTPPPLLQKHATGMFQPAPQGANMEIGNFTVREYKLVCFRCKRIVFPVSNALKIVLIYFLKTNKYSCAISKKLYFTLLLFQ